jgi:hypothetical protein
MGEKLNMLPVVNNKLSLIFAEKYSIAFIGILQFSTPQTV